MFFHCKKLSQTQFTFFSTIIVSLGSFLFGYQSAVIAGALFFVSREFKMSPFLESIIVSFLLIGAFVGSIAGGYLSDKIGRKKTLVVTAILFLIGIAILVIAKDIRSFSSGRIIVGVAIGIISVVAPLYISEISLPEKRGALVTISQFAITFGIFFAFMLGYLFAESGMWRYMFGCGLIPSFIFLLGLFFIPETPNWLAAQGRYVEAKKTVMFFHNPSPYEEAIVEKKEKISLFNPAIRSALVVGMGLSIFQQITGINTVLYFGPKILYYASFSSPSSANFAMMWIGIFKLFIIFIVIWLVDKVGRRPLLIVGISGQIICFALLSLSFYISVPFLKEIAIILLVLYVCFFAIGLGPVTWLILAEIYRLQVRGKAMGVSIPLNWFFNYLIALSFLPMLSSIGIATTIFIYSIIGIFALWFVIAKVPETKGKRLEDIQKFWIADK